MIENIIKTNYILRNWLSYITSRITPIPVGYVIIGITYSCNSRCIMCNIWKKRDDNKKEVEMETFLNTIKQSQILNKIFHFDITGGEPFLRDDIADFIYNLFALPSVKLITLNTNGLLTNKICYDVESILKKIPENKKFSISISLDGTGQIYSKIRGIKDGYEIVLNTIENLVKIREKYKQLELRSNCVIQRLNIEHLGEIKKFWRDDNLKGEFAIIQTPFVTHGENSEYCNYKFSYEELEIIKNINNLPLGIKIWLKNKGRRPIRCFGGFSSVYIDPYGDVYPCNFLGENSEYIMGNIRNNNFDKIWVSKNAWRMRDKIKRCPFVNCWNGCEVYQTLVQYSILNKIIKIISFGTIDYYKLRGYY